MIVAYAYTVACSYNKFVSLHLAFYFGFEQQEYVYNEKHDEGPQDISFSSAPGNKTEKNFIFALNLNAIQGAFTFGSMCY